MTDDDLRARLTQALMKREGCERAVDDHFTPYCAEHHAGWLHDVDACAHSAVNVEIALMPVIREALADCHDNAIQAAGEHAMGGPMPDNPWREQS